MSDQETCRRCKDPLLTKPYPLVLEARDFGGEPRGVELCGRCAESFGRWMGRKGRRRENPDGTEPPAEPSRSARKGRRQGSDEGLFENRSLATQKHMMQLMIWGALTGGLAYVAFSVVWWSLGNYLKWPGF